MLMLALGANIKIPGTEPEFTMIASVAYETIRPLLFEQILATGFGI
jgi:hypothetical protein